MTRDTECQKVLQFKVLRNNNAKLNIYWDNNFTWITVKSQNNMLCRVITANYERIWIFEMERTWTWMQHIKKLWRHIRTSTVKNYKLSKRICTFSKPLQTALDTAENRIAIEKWNFVVCLNGNGCDNKLEVWILQRSSQFFKTKNLEFVGCLF